MVGGRRGSVGGGIAGTTNVLESHGGQDALGGPLGVLVGKVGQVNGVLYGLKKIRLNLVVGVGSTVA